MDVFVDSKRVIVDFGLLDEENHSSDPFAEFVKGFPPDLAPIA